MPVEAPERIWVEHDPWTNEKRWFSVKGMGGIEYVRADKLEELAAENELLVSNFKTMCTVQEAALAEKDKEIAALRELVDSAESIFINCSVTDGVCCCGDNMETHAEPMSCGHTPVDHGAYLVAIWLESRNAGGKNA